MRIFPNVFPTFMDLKDNTKLTRTDLFKSINLLLFGALCSMVVCSCKYGRLVYYNFADVSDYKKFPNRIIENGDSPFMFPLAKKPKFPKKIEIEGTDVNFETFLESQHSVAFLIIKDDSIHYENYWNKYDESSIVPSFSVAKTVTSILVGCAIDDKLISSVNDPVIDYIPELSEGGFQKVTIEHLLQMTSHLKFKEAYVDPFAHVAAFYYGKRLRKSILKLKIDGEPGTKFNYQSGSSQILGLVLERAIGNKTLSQYLEEKLWQPLGMEFKASWSMDKEKNGIEKTFCCINARARDYAKIGRLYLNKGSWNGQKIVSEDWVSKSTKVDSSQGSAPFYQYQWWIPSSHGDFMAKGVHGQYIYVNPAKNIIIVRLGKKSGKIDWEKFMMMIAENY